MTILAAYVTFQANAVEPTIPGHRCCPLEGLSAAALGLPAQARTAQRAAASSGQPVAAKGRFGGESI